MYYAIFKEGDDDNKYTFSSRNCQSIKDLGNHYADSIQNPIYSHLVDGDDENEMLAMFKADGFEVVASETPFCESCIVRDGKFGCDTTEAEYHEGYNRIMSYCNNCCYIFEL